jgi:hypothetical protein
VASACGIVLATGTLLVAAPGAGAAVVDLTCPGQQATSYDPGVTFVPRTVHITTDGVLGPCVSSDPTVLSGSYHDDVTGTVDCTFGSVHGIRTIAWNNGRTSTVSFTTALDAKPDGETVVVEQGSVTSGEFTGDATLTTITLAHTALLACATPTGVTSTAGPVATTYSG